MNIPGEDIFAPSGGRNVFEVMAGLKTALAANDSETIRETLDDLNDVRAQVSAAQASVGTRLKTVMAGKDLREQLELSFAEQRDAVVDTDPAEAFTNFTQTQYSLQAALAQAQRVIQSLDSGLR
jgi:flagellin-like hook-associated protein FlgL